ASGTGDISGLATRSLSSTSSVDYQVEAGTYSVAEAPLDGWSQTDNTCTGVVVAPGQTATCTITNRNASCDPRLRVVNTVTCPVADRTAFAITASGTGTITGPANRSLTSAASVEYVVTAGTYSVAEDALPGWTQTDNTCSGVVVAPNQTATCTITNRN